MPDDRRVREDAAGSDDAGWNDVRSTDGDLRHSILRGNPVLAAYRLNFLANFFTGPLYKRMEAETGITRPEFIVMLCLDHRPGVTGQDISAATGRPKNSLSRAIARLETKGLIARTVDSSDQRRQPMVLTDAGRETYRDLLPRVVERESQMLAPLSVRERRELLDLLGKMCRASDGWAETY